MCTETSCIIITNKTDYYERRKRVVKKKYGDALPKNAQYFMQCGNEQCVNPDHILLQNTIFEEYGSKPCSNCGRWLPRHAFYDDLKSSNGTMSKCKTCYKISKIPQD